MILGVDIVMLYRKSMGPKIEFDSKHKKFFVSMNGKEAVLEFVEVGSDTLNFTHTYVPGEFRGQGMAAKLVEVGLKYARDQGKKVIASCSYVKSYLDTHAEFNELR